MGELRSVLEIELATDGEDEEELADLTQRLRGELVELDVDEVALARDGESPAGAKAIEAAALGGLLVHLALRRATLTAVGAAIRDWLKRQRGSTLTVKLTLDGDTLELTGTSSAQLDRLVELWVAHHAVSA